MSSAWSTSPTCAAPGALSTASPGPPPLARLDALWALSCPTQPAACLFGSFAGSCGCALASWHLPRRRDAAGRARRGAQVRSLAAYVGTLTRHRGLEQAIEALVHVPQLRLICIGPQAHGYAGELRALAARHGVADWLDLRAPLRPEDIPEALAALRPAFGLALIQPSCLSYRLSLPNKLYEYALGGVPVLGSDLPMIADWLSATGIGSTVDAADGPQGLGEAMEAMLDPDAQRAWRKRAQRLVDARPWLAEERALADVYADVLGGGRRHSIRRWLRSGGKRASAG